MSDNFNENTAQFNIDDLLDGAVSGDDGASDGYGDTATIDVSQIRRVYGQDSLRRGDLETDPILQFGAWMQEVVQSENREPTAMSLATATPDGRPSVRTVLLKGYDARGFRFFTNYLSRKGKELEANPNAALCFFWPEMERQVRIEGRVEKVVRLESEAYFKSRPHGSQVSAASSPQSQVVANREELESRRREVENRFAGQEVELPEDWGGFRLWPELFEFWQGRPDRTHDRFRYRRAPDGDPVLGNEWLIERLAP